MTTRGLYPVMILVGGAGARLGELTATLPKALVDVLGEPFLAHQLRLLADRGVDRVVLCIGTHGDQIRDAIGDGRSYGLIVDYSDDGPNPLGTAGALRAAAPLVDGPFFVLYGDSYLRCDHAAVQHAFARSELPGLMTVHHNRDRWAPSNVAYSDGRVAAYDKGARSEAMQWIDYGLSVFEPAAFDGVPTDRPTDLGVVVRQLVAERRLAAFEVDERFYEIGSTTGLDEFRRYVADAERPSDPGPNHVDGPDLGGAAS